MEQRSDEDVLFVTEAGEAVRPWTPAWWRFRMERYGATVRMSPRRRELLALQLARLPAGARHVLDVGAGEGTFASLAKGERPLLSLVLVDFCQDALVQAGENLVGVAGVELRLIDCVTKFSAEERFDCVVAGLLLSHLKGDDGLAQERALRVLHDALLPGGTLVVGDQIWMDPSVPADPALALRLVDEEFFQGETPENRVLLGDAQKHCNVLFIDDLLRKLRLQGFIVDEVLACGRIAGVVVAHRAVAS